MATLHGVRCVAALVVAAIAFWMMRRAYQTGSLLLFVMGVLVLGAGGLVLPAVRR